jgi:transposase
MAGGIGGFIGRSKVVEHRVRGKRHWPNEAKARIATESS